MENPHQGELDHLVIRDPERAWGILQQLIEPKFRKCLRVVWGENSITPEIWKRINQACGAEPIW